MCAHKVYKMTIFDEMKARRIEGEKNAIQTAIRVISKPENIKKFCKEYVESLKRQNIENPEEVAKKEIKKCLESYKRNSNIVVMWEKAISEF